MDHLETLATILFSIVALVSITVILEDMNYHWANKTIYLERQGEYSNTGKFFRQSQWLFVFAAFVLVLGTAVF